MAKKYISAVVLIIMIFAALIVKVSDRESVKDSPSEKEWRSDAMESIHAHHAHDMSETSGASHICYQSASRREHRHGDAAVASRTTADIDRSVADVEIVDCTACNGTGLSYEARQTNFIDRDMISASAGLYKCPVCNGEKKVDKSVAYARWKAEVELRAALADIDARNRQIPCAGCDGTGKCWQCHDQLPYRNIDCFCCGSGKCRTCYGSGHL